MEHHGSCCKTGAECESSYLIHYVELDVCPS